MHAFADPQYESLSQLLHTLRQGFPVEEVVGHADIAAGRDAPMERALALAKGS